MESRLVLLVFVIVNSLISAQGQCLTGEVYISSHQLCVQLAAEANGWKCDWDEQCYHSTPGHYSRCAREHAHCECYDTDGGFPRRPTVSINHTCSIRKEIGGICQNDMTCQQSISGGVYCAGLSEDSDRGICQCRYAHFYDGSIRECLQYGTLHSACKIDSQCSHIRGLGDLSRCNSKKGKCECWDNSNGEPVGFTNGKCWYKRGPNESCIYREECVVGYHPDAVCRSHESYWNETVCQCREESVCDITDIRDSDMIIDSSGVKQSCTLALFSNLLPAVVVLIPYFLFDRMGMGELW